MEKPNGDNGVAFGIIGGICVGLLAFAITGNPVWYAYGMCFGMPVGIIIGRLRANWLRRCGHPLYCAMRSAILISAWVIASATGESTCRTTFATRGRRSPK